MQISAASTVTINSENKILIAVSGGSDSLALLRWLANKHEAEQLSVATVDHGLRAESRDEANWVKQVSARLGLSHQTLAWRPGSNATSSTAREARYQLLVNHAVDINCSIIALGHTLNDQAETLMMRAARMTSDSDTRGLSGMAEWSTYHDTRLWRPFLSCDRSDLRLALSQVDQLWIDDPTNKNLTSERVRVRNRLNASHDIAPTIEQIGRLAHMSGRTRHWINEKTAAVLEKCTRVWADGTVEFGNVDGIPVPILQESLSVLVLTVGSMEFRTPRYKIRALIDALVDGSAMTKSVGRCIIRVKKRTVTISREQRSRQKLPPINSYDQISPIDLNALLKFRPRSDDCIFAAMQKLASKPSVHPNCST